VLAAVLLVETADGAASGDARHCLSHRLPIGLRYEVDGEKRSAILTEVGARRYQVTLAGERDEFAVVDLDGHSVRFLCDGVMESAIYARDGARLMLHFRGETHDVVDATLAGAARRDSGGERDGRLRASMNGRVVSVFVAAGDRVAAGQPVLTLEAMKMEHIHAAPISGLVKALHVAVGDQAPANRVVAEIEPDVVATQ
jgi:geranyl-CoA carboxylase alpha subunit